MHHILSVRGQSKLRGLSDVSCECLGQRGREGGHLLTLERFAHPTRVSGLAPGQVLEEVEQPRSPRTGWALLPRLRVLNSWPPGGLCPVLVPGHLQPLAGRRWCTPSCSSGREKAPRTEQRGGQGPWAPRGGQGKVTSVQDQAELCAAGGS